MKGCKVLSFMVVVLFLAGLSSAATLSRHGTPHPLNLPGRVVNIDSTGGPDHYGYTWQDTVIQGTFIRPDTTTWTQVTGLGDDNALGPFPIGFTFPYYWYGVTTFSVGSNGYVCFGQPGLMASPFDTIPCPDHVNDLLAIYESDLDYSNRTGWQNPGRCWYHTNAAQDTLIVACTHVPHWWPSGNPRGNLNFEVILSKPDSTITFVYDTVQYTQPPSGDDREVGIENGSGTLGLERRRAGTGLTIPDFWVVKFTPPATTTYQALDAGPVDVMNTGSHGFFGMLADTVHLWATVRNQGNVPITAPYSVWGRILDSTGTPIAETIATAPPSVPNQVDTIRFGDWNPPMVGNYTFLARTLLTDSNPLNDVQTDEFWAVTEPPVLRYDLNIGGGYSWSGDYGGFANEFWPPEYFFKVDTTYLYIYPGTGSFITGIYDASGTGGSPGNLLSKSDTVASPASAGWIAVDQTYKNIVVTSGAFYVAWLQDVASPPAIGQDSTPPHARNSWEFTGVWAPWRESNRDLMIRVKGHKTNSGVASGGRAGGNAEGIQFSALRPNPSRSSITAAFNLPGEGKVRLAVYDLRGALVRTLVNDRLPAGKHQVVWDGRDDLGRPVASGVYFYRLEALGERRTQKSLLLR